MRLWPKSCLFWFAVLIAASACGSGAVRAIQVAPRPVASASSSAPAVASAAPSGPVVVVQETSWCVDARHSTLQVAGADRVLGEHVGTVGRFSGVLLTAGREPRSLRIEFDLTTLHLESSLVEDFVKSADFMDVERYPTAVFEAKELRFGAAGQPGEVVGDLTLHGLTRTFRFPFESTLGEREGSLRANVLLPRRAFDILPRKRHWDIFISPDFRIALDLKMVSARTDGSLTSSGASVGACGNLAKARP